MRRILYRTHVWLGWIVGAQLILWMLSGLVMTVLPIELVHGDHLRADVPARRLDGMGLLPPADILSKAPGADELILTHLLDRPVYRLSAHGHPTALHDAASGAEIRVDADLAARIAIARYAGKGRIDSVRHIPDGRAVGEFRREAPAYAVRFDDPEGTIFYIHATTGEIAAVRTDRWRLFDLMWGLHIMDWRAREDFNHPLLITAAALGLASVSGGAGLLMYRLRRRKGGARPVGQG